MQASTEERMGLIEQACEWIFRLRENPSPEQSAAFLDWVKQSAGHMEAFLCAEALICGVETGELPEVLPDSEPANDPDLGCREMPQEKRTWSERFSDDGALVAACLSVLALVVLIARTVLHATTHPAPVAHIYTRPGEYTLAPTSVMYLYEGSQAEVTPDGTRVTLLMGRAHFSGTHDEARPLTVLSGIASVAVNGTDFDVWHQLNSTAVRVFDGRVTVDSVCSSSRDSFAPIKLESDDAVTISGDACKPRVELSLLRRPVAVPPSQRLVFRSTTVTDAARMFSRPGHVQIIIDDPVLARTRIGAAFNAADPESFVQALETSFHGHAVRSIASDGSTVIHLVRSESPQD